MPECLRALGSVARGPFRCTLHPADWGSLVVVLRFPHLTVNRATLAVLSVVYLVTGSIQEEYRLLAEPLPAAYSVSSPWRAGERPRG